MQASLLQRPPFTLTTVALVLFGYGPPAAAQAVQSLYSPVIILYDGMHVYAGTDTARGWLQMREDGSGLAQIASAGNLSRIGGAGGRYFLAPQDNSDVTMPDGSSYIDCVAWHENGDPSTRRVLTSDHTLSRGDCQWSADGTHVIYGGRRFDASGSAVESGAFLGDVEWVSGEPVRVYNERLIASHRLSEYLSITGADVDATGERVAFKLSLDVRDAQGKHVRTDTFGFFLAAVPPVVEGQPLPPPATPVRIVLSTPDAERGCCAFSPVAGDNRMLYSERSPSKWPYINYFWTVDLPEQYDGSYALVPIQVTTKTNSSANYLHGGAAWSPTASHIAYLASRNADWTAVQLYKIAANGKGKAIRLTSDPDGYAGLRWAP
jgi:hypothetical protein